MHIFTWLAQVFSGSPSTWLAQNHWMNFVSESVPASRLPRPENGLSGVDGTTHFGLSKSFPRDGTSTKFPPDVPCSSTAWTDTLQLLTPALSNLRVSRSRPKSRKAARSTATQAARQPAFCVNPRNRWLQMLPRSRLTRNVGRQSWLLCGTWRSGELPLRRTIRVGTIFWFMKSWNTKEC